MNSDPHNRVLDAYFWHFVDRGDAPGDTPLFTGSYASDSLARSVAQEFDVPSREAESVIEIARKEVAL